MIVGGQSSCNPVPAALAARFCQPQRHISIPKIPPQYNNSKKVIGLQAVWCQSDPQCTSSCCIVFCCSLLLLLLFA